MLLDAAGSGGQLAVLRGRQVGGDAAPWHVHGREDETMIVLHGAALVWIGDRTHPQHVRAGDVAFIPRDVRTPIASSPTPPTSCSSRPRAGSRISSAGRDTISRRRCPPVGRSNRRRSRPRSVSTAARSSHHLP
ncbi:cupin domain-containing protein [Egibacter rhizosphaerae]|uniref:cupin domain-containing protein n=1 Tax=Egibacter rhizosphaerae TaxID=1670831 RepID=UPI003B8359E0